MDETSFESRTGTARTEGPRDGKVDSEALALVAGKLDRAADAMIGLGKAMTAREAGVADGKGNTEMDNGVAPEWAKQLDDKIDKLITRVGSLETRVRDPDRADRQRAAARGRGGQGTLSALELGKLAEAQRAAAQQVEGACDKCASTIAEVASAAANAIRLASEVGTQKKGPAPKKERTKDKKDKKEGDQIGEIRRAVVTAGVAMAIVALLELAVLLLIVLTR